MAEKSVVFSLKVNTGNSVQELENMVNETNQLNNALDKTGQELNNNATFAQRYGDELQPLTTRMGEAEDRLYELALAGQQASQEYKDLLASVANYRRTQIETDMVVDQAASTMSEKLVGAVELGAGVFQGAQSAVALFGVENEKLTETMVRLQAVQGVVSSVMIIQEQLRQKNIISTTIMNGLEKAKTFIMTGSIGATTGLAAAEGGLTVATNTATFATKAFRAALIATGIGAIIVLVGVLIANFDTVSKVVVKLSGYVVKAYDYFDKLGVGIKVLVGIFFPFIGVVYAAIKALEYFNIIDTKQERDASARHQANMKRIDKELEKREKQKKQREENFNKEQSALARELRLLESLGKSTDALAIKKIQGSIAFQKEQLKELELNRRILQATNAGGFLDDLIAQTKTHINETKEAILDGETSIQIIKNNSQRKQQEDAKKAHDKEKKDVSMKSDELDKILSDGIEKDKQRILDFNKWSAEQQQAYFDAEEKAFLDEMQRLENEEKLKQELLDNYNSIVLSKEAQLIADVNKERDDQASELVLALSRNLITEEEYANALILLNEQTEAKITGIKKKTAEDQTKIDKEKTDAILKNIDEVIKVARAFQETMGALNGLLKVNDEKRIKELEGNETAQNEIRKKAFNREKALKISEVIISTASAISKSVAASPVTFGLPFSAFSAITGAAQIAAIAKTKFDSGGTPPTAPPPGDTSLGASASSFTANTNTQQTDLNSDNVTGTNLQNVTKVAVLEYDITNVQSKVAVQEVKSSF
jgi:hypothetical protein